MNTVPHEYRGTAGRARLLEVLSSQKLVQRDPTIAKDLLAVAKPMTFLPRRDKDHLIVEGERKFDIYFILSGSVSVRIKRQEVAIRGPGDHVGEMALIDSKHPRSASVIATERTTVAKVSQQAFLKVAAKHPELWQRLCVELAAGCGSVDHRSPSPTVCPRCSSARLPASSAS